MAEFFTMPRLGQSMEEGTVVRWFKQEGEPVRKGDLLLEVMTDKSNVEVESSADGVVRRILVAADKTVPVGEPLAIIAAADESLDEAAPAPGVRPEIPAAERPDASPSFEAGSLAAPEAGRTPISPRARRLMDARGIQPSELAGRGSGPGGRVLEKDVEAYLAGRQRDRETRPRATPMAARLADELGIDVASLAHGLPGSRITADVVRSMAAAETAGGPRVAEVIPLRGLRRLVAENVTRSRQTAPHVTLNAEADVTSLAAMFPRVQEEVQSLHGVRLSYTDFLVRAAAVALRDHPLCNAALIEDEIRVYEDRNIGVAVATDGGLLVPVIRRADSRTLPEISRDLKALVERCRAGRQTPDDLDGGTFTITNLGAFGIDTFDPILVPPQSCILGVGRIAEKVVAVGGRPAVRSLMSLSLSFDHRVLDGVPAARFLQRVRELLEAPLLALL